MTSRRVDPIRRQSTLDPRHRRKVHRAYQHLRTELDRTDAVLARLAARRHRLALRLADHRDQLWPPDRQRFGRRPGADGRPQLPPLPSPSTRLWGRRLRAVCLALLRRAGEVTLTELHVLLHRGGYEIDSTHPVKALADALGYETDHGRAHRVARGVYGPVLGPSVTAAGAAPAGGRP